MATSGVQLAFSNNVEYCAYSSPDGSLKLWETDTGSLKQEYVPSSHLSATCSCLKWGPSKTEDSPKKKKKKRRSEVEKAVEKLDLIALGTTSGSLLLYSLTKGDLHTQLNHGHVDRVNDVCWHPSGEILYSCSSDQHIVQWQILKATVKHKWKADKSGVYSIALGPTEDQLISAGRVIKLWNLVNHEELRTFSGHATEILQLLPVPNYIGGVGAANGESALPVSSTYFLSAAANDRLIHAWQTSSKDKTSLVSFALPDEPVRMCISPHLYEQTILLCATTKSGQLVVFEHVLNGRVKKPLKPKVTLQVATDTPEMPIPLPLLGAYFTADLESTLVFAYGTFLKPSFEKALYRSLESNTCLVRKDPNRTSLTVESSTSKIQTPGVSRELTVLAPGHMAPVGPVMEGQTAKRKRRKSTSAEMSLDERLHAISIEKPKVKAPPKSDSVLTLLTQGLQSQDTSLLASLLQMNNDVVINNTVRQLPLPYVIPFVRQLVKGLHGHASRGNVLLKWTKAVLSSHASYLSSYPDLIETLGNVHQMVENRVMMYGRLSKLYGKVDLMLAQVAAQRTEATEEENTASTSQPLLVYQDDSSEEDIIADLSGSENEWDEQDSMSEMEVADEEGDDSEDEEDADGETKEDAEGEVNGEADDSDDSEDEDEDMEQEEGESD